MKKCYAVIPFVLLFAQHIYGQNYHMLNAGSELFFLPSSSCQNYMIDPYTVFGLKCDSAQGTGSDSVFFPYRTIRQVLPADSVCSVDPSYPIWAGIEIGIDTNSSHRWQTLSGDSVIINTQTNPGDTQQIYLYPNGDRIIAVHTSNSQLTFASITDSVKNYAMQAVDVSNNPLPCYWNGKQIIVSKNNGVVQLPSILGFPDDTFYFSRVSAKRLTYADVFPWQAGDVLHEQDYAWNQLSFYYNNWTYNKTILSRTMVNADSVVFTIARTTHYVSNGPPANTMTMDTITYGVGRLSSYIENVMPQQTIDSTRTYDLYLYANDCGKLRMVDHIQDAFYIAGPGCVGANNFEPEFHDNIYIDGVAGYYFHDFPSAQNNGEDDEFRNLYWYIGNSSCGTPLWLGGEETVMPVAKVWPNPVYDVLNIEMVNNIPGCSLVLFDELGNVIRTIPVAENNSVDVKSFSAGMYFGKIVSADGSFQGTIRFVKQ